MVNLYINHSYSTRQIFAIPKTEVCELMGNYKSNPFMNPMISKLKEAYPGAIHKCPYKVTIFKNNTIFCI